MVSNGKYVNIDIASETHPAKAGIKTWVFFKPFSFEN